VTGQVAEYEAVRLLGVSLAPARQKGFNATRDGQRLQITGCCVSRGEAGWRMSVVRLDREWDAVVLVLMDPGYETYEVWEADRSALTPALQRIGSRGLPVKQFKELGHRRWPAAGA
jgi:hypothetical protein